MDNVSEREAGAKQERDRIIAWLRGAGNALYDIDINLADAIERLEHRKDQSDD